MKRQIIVIHGGGSFIPKEKQTMLEVIANKKASLDDMRRHDNWKSSLQEMLGDEYDVLSPRMPNADAPHYKEWKLWFEKMLPLFDDNAFFVGHSLGGMFLAKYFSENSAREHVLALFLVAPPYDDLGYGWSIGNVSLLAERADSLFIYHSKDDMVVPFESSQKFKSSLPTATVRELDGRGHFRENDFPELVQDIAQVVSEQ